MPYGFVLATSVSVMDKLQLFVLATTVLVTLATGVVGCQHGDVKLVNGNSPNEGRVEICINNQWGTVTDDGWSSGDSQVVCRQLGYPTDGVQYFGSAYFGQGNGPIFLDNVACSGSEVSLLSCSYSTPTSSDTHSEDVGVKCPVCTNGDLRLWSSSNTTPPGQGMLHICVSNNWQVVCDDYWDCNDAMVACRQLGYNGNVSRHLVDVDDIYGYFSPLWPYRYDCTGSEDTLQSCPYSYYSGCNTWYFDLAGVQCTNTSENSCTDGQVQLVGGKSSNEGILEYCYQGQWAFFCNLENQVAAVACKQLGYTAFPWGAVFSDHSFGVSRALSSFSDIRCSYDARETNLTQCITSSTSCYSGTCYTADGIRCYEPGGCTESSVRLSGGDIEQEGIPEVCVNGVWGSICDERWSSTTGKVFCRQLGYNDNVPAAYTNSYFGAGEGPIVWGYMSCSGLESSFSQCSRSQYPYVHCSRDYVAGVLCRDGCSCGDVQLTGGHSDSDGTVEVCYNNIWGLIDVSGWGENDTIVICRQLGYSTSNARSILNSSYERPNRTVHLTNVLCSGNEESINACTKTSIPLEVGKTTYRNSTVVAVDCSDESPTESTCLPKQGLMISALPCSTEGSVRLVDGNTNSEGRLEFCYTRKWSPFCTLDFSAASVACKQLGYSQYTGATVITNGMFGSSLHYSLFENITCSENAIESSLMSCTLYSTDCLPLCPNNIAIRCYNPGSCEEGAVRLVDGIIDQEGRVEVCHDGVWGTICNEGWDKTDAHVICQQLGYARTVSIAYHYSYFGAGNGPIIFSDVDCGGWENSFSECSKISFPHFFCSQNSVSGLLCGYDCEDGDVQLVGGNSETEGIIQVCFSNQWGLISESGWSQKDAQVVCRELGFLVEGAVAVGGSAYSKTNLTVHLSNVYCTGLEENIAQCIYTPLSLEDGKALLNQVEVAGVSCQVQENFCQNPLTGRNDCSPGDIRLVAKTSTTLQTNSTTSQGNLEYCYKGLWSSVCSISESAATVACKQLGFTRYTWTSIYDDGHFGLSSHPSFVRSFVCSENGSEANLTECKLVDACTSTCSSITVGIQCYGPGECSEGEVRLADGDIKQEGRVEVCLGGVWGSVCGDGWDQTDAHTLCQQLDLGEGEPTLYSDSEFGEGKGPIVLSNVECGGWETDIFQCSNKEYLTFSCPRNHTAGVLCRDLCTDGAVRFSGGLTESEGTVEICFDNLWGLVAQSKWSTSDAQVTCRQLGYPSQGAQAVLNSFFGKPDKTLHLSAVVCIGSEDRLVECSAELLLLKDSKDIVKHVEVAGVLCKKPASSSNSLSISSLTSITPMLNSSATPSADVNEHLISYSINYTIIGVLGSATLIGMIINIILLVIICSRKKLLLHGKKWNEYETNTMVLQPIANRKGAANPTFSSSQEMLENVKEMKKEEECDD